VQSCYLIAIVDLSGQYAGTQLACIRRDLGLSRNVGGRCVDACMCVHKCRAGNSRETERLVSAWYDMETHKNIKSIGA